MRKKKRNRSIGIIVIGFLFMYGACMFLATYMVRGNYMETYEKELSDTRTTIRREIENTNWSFDENGQLTESSVYEMQKIVSKCASNVSAFSYMSAGVYEEEQIHSTKAYFDPPDYGEEGEGHIEHFYLLEELFTEEEIREIASYYDQEMREEKEEGYGCGFYYDKDGKLSAFRIFDNSVKETYNNTVFYWKNAGVGINGGGFEIPVLTSYLYFPQLRYSQGMGSWEKWRQDELLHEFSLAGIKELVNTDYPESYKEPEGFPLSEFLFDGDEEGGTFHQLLSTISVKKEIGGPALWTIQLNQRTYPWRAAVDYLKDMYIYAGMFLAASMLIVLYFTGRAREKQEALEETRRDFTNAIAHEMKTPLSIMRGLAENLNEEESRERKEFYTGEMIRQTEIMDSMVKEMVLISRLDSDALQLKDEPVDVLELVKEQQEELKSLIEGGDLFVSYQEEAVFLINGDKSYLSKAVRNLLENAVFYNKEGGTIEITVKERACVIENTADPIPQEDLPHVCDMFFTGNKSRTSNTKHMGLGLYLAKKIFYLHGLELAVENTDKGVKVSFFKK